MGPRRGWLEPTLTLVWVGDDLEDPAVPAVGDGGLLRMLSAKLELDPIVMRVVDDYVVGDALITAGAGRRSLQRLRNAGDCNPRIRGGARRRVEGATVDSGADLGGGHAVAEKPRRCVDRDNPRAIHDPILSSDRRSGLSQRPCRRRPVSGFSIAVAAQAIELSRHSPPVDRWIPARAIGN